MERTRMFQLFFGGFIAIAITANSYPEESYSPKSKPLPKSIPAPLHANLQFGDLPLRLEQSSQLAFNRGLMPLESRLKYLALARDARLSSAGDSETQRQEVWQSYRNQIAGMVSRIQSLNQPGASGWTAELLLARYSVLRADQQLASMSGDMTKSAEANAQLQMTSSQLYRQREIDYAAGLASLQDLMYARDRFMNANDSQAIDRISNIETVLLTQDNWNSLGAEIGRADRLLETQLAKEMIVFQDSLQSGTLEEISKNMADLNELGHEHFSTTFNYFKNGTAPLHQLTNSIVIRQPLQQLSEEYPELKNTISEKQFREDWSTLKSLAERTSDRRGRNEADLLAIDLLSVSVESTKDRN